MKTFATLFLFTLCGFGLVSFKYQELDNKHRELKENISRLKFERDEAKYQFKICRYLYKKGCPK